MKNAQAGPAKRKEGSIQASPRCLLPAGVDNVPSLCQSTRLVNGNFCAVCDGAPIDGGRGNGE